MKHAVNGKRPRPPKKTISGEVIRLVNVITPELFADVCAALSAGEPIRRILAEFRINPRSFYLFLQQNDAQAQHYARAKDDGLDSLADETIEIADAPGDPNDKRVRIDTRKWLLSKLKARKYGERVTLAGDPDAPIEHHVDVDRELEGRLLPEFAAGGPSGTTREPDGGAT